MPDRGGIIAAALIAAAATVGAALITAAPWEDDDTGQGSSTQDPGNGGGGAEVTVPELPDSSPASIFLSNTSGPGGSSVNVSGDGFAPNERVVIRFHTEQIGATSANDQGAFSNVSVTIPTSFSDFAPQQFDIVATGEASVKTATAPFTISG